MGYGFVAPADHAGLRDGENQVLFRPHLVEALMRINGIDRVPAEAAYGELAAISNNESWLKVLRGDYARKRVAENRHHTHSSRRGYALKPFVAERSNVLLLRPISVGCEGRTAAERQFAVLPAQQHV
jgi:hypothetical protein